MKFRYVFPILSLLFAVSSCSFSQKETISEIKTSKSTIKKIEFTETTPNTEKSTTATTVSEEEDEDDTTFSDMESFIEYMRECVDNRMTEITASFTDDFIPSLKEIVVYANFPYLNAEIRRYGEGRADGIYTTELYPGTKIADAYLNGDTSSLSDEELKVYDIAAKIVDEAKAFGSPLEAERYIHDSICNATNYCDIKENKVMSRYSTAVGVFIDGLANCQGYADAFCMLAAMYGFEADKLSGVAAEAEHVWNIIKLDGEWYSVDVCWDDNVFATSEKDYIQYYYFNAPTEIMRGDHVWNDMATPYSLKKKIDEKYFYYGENINGFGLSSDSLTEAVEYCAEGLINGTKEINIMAPYGEEYDTAEELCDGINLYITEKKVAHRIQYNAYVKNIGNYTYLYVELT